VLLEKTVTSLSDYLESGGGLGLELALGASPEAVIEEVVKSGLRGPAHDTAPAISRDPVSPKQEGRPRSERPSAIPERHASCSTRSRVALAAAAPSLAPAPLACRKPNAARIARTMPAAIIAKPAYRASVATVHQP
jgi:hypothetical protein